MARKRFIDPAIWISEDFTSLSIQARLLFIGLFSLADDEGRGKGSPQWLKMAVFPSDTFTSEQIESWVGEVATRGMARFYEVRGVRYYDLPRWSQYQKPQYPSPSRVPPLPESSGSPHGTFMEDSTSTPIRVWLGRDGLGRDGSDRDGLGGDGEGREPETAPQIEDQREGGDSVDSANLKTEQQQTTAVTKPLAPVVVNDSGSVDIHQTVRGMLGTLSSRGKMEHKQGAGEARRRLRLEDAKRNQP